MKLILPLLLSIFSFGISKAQPQVFQDSLAQFSYLLYGSTVLNKPNESKKVQGKQGTGFFIKSDHRIYFVTAKHAVTNHIIYGQNRNEFPKEYNVYSHYSDQFNFISLPAIWRNHPSKIKSRLNDADVISYEVTNKLKGFPISIISLTKSHSDFISSKSEFDEIRIFGFPESMNKMQNGIIQITPPYLFTSNRFTISQNFINQIGNEVGIDSLRYEVQITDSKVTSAFKGFSGSSVFIGTHKADKWEFLGILVAINTIRNSIYVVNFLLNSEFL